MEEDSEILEYDEEIYEHEEEKDINFEKPILDFKNDDAEKRLEDLVTVAEEALYNKKGRQSIKFSGMNLTIKPNSMCLRNRKINF